MLGQEGSMTAEEYEKRCHSIKAWELGEEKLEGQLALRGEKLRAMGMVPMIIGRKMQTYGIIEAVYAYNLEIMHDAGSTTEARNAAAQTLLSAVKAHNSVDESLLLITQGYIGPPKGNGRQTTIAPNFNVQVVNQHVGSKEKVEKLVKEEIK